MIGLDRLRRPLTDGLSQDGVVFNFLVVGLVVLALWGVFSWNYYPLFESGTLDSFLVRGAILIVVALFLLITTRRPSSE
jgi:uncharacterized membrane protein